MLSKRRKRLKKNEQILPIFYKKKYFSIWTIFCKKIFFFIFGRFFLKIYILKNTRKIRKIVENCWFCFCFFRFWRHFYYPVSGRIVLLSGRIPDSRKKAGYPAGYPANRISGTPLVTPKHLILVASLPTSHSLPTVGVHREAVWVRWARGRARGGAAPQDRDPRARLDRPRERAPAASLRRGAPTHRSPAAGLTSCHLQLPRRRQRRASRPPQWSASLSRYRMS